MNWQSYCQEHPDWYHKRAPKFMKQKLPLCQLSCREKGTMNSKGPPTSTLLFQPQTLPSSSGKDQSVIEAKNSTNFFFAHACWTNPEVKDVPSKEHRCELTFSVKSHSEIRFKCPVLRRAKSPIANRSRSANAVNSRKPFRSSMWNEC